MSPYNNLSSLATIIGLLIILGLVASKNYKSKLNRMFIAFGLVTTLYVGFVYLSNFPSHYSEVLLFTRMSLFMASFIPITFLLFTYAFVGRKKIFNTSMYILIISSVILAALAFSPQAIGAVTKQSYGVDLSKTGPLLWLTLIDFVILTTYSFFLLIGYARKSDKATQSQVYIIVFTSFLVITLNMITQIVLPEFHQDTYGNIIGNPSIVLFVGGIGYTILRHKLFDIRTVALRTLGFVLTLMVVMITFAIIMLVPSKLLFRNLYLNDIENLYFIAAAIILCLLFNPMKALLEKITDQLFFQVTYNSEQLVNDISKILASEIRLEEMTSQVIEILRKRMNIKEIDIIVLDAGKIYFESGKYFSPIINNLQNDLNKIESDIVVTDRLPEGPEKSMLEKYKIQVVSKMKVRDDTVGYILFSNRARGLGYVKQDLLVTDIVSDELAIAIQNSRAYDQIRQFNASLQRKVEESTSQLLLANDELKKASATKDDFISMVSHQLGTPLTVMEGFLSLITQGFYDKDSDQAKEALKKALSRTRVMKNLVFDLLNLSRMSAGKFFLELSPVNLNEVVKDEVSQLDMEAKDKNVTLTYHDPETPVPIIQLDEAKTRQAIMNLVNNAIFYSPSGKVDVYLSSDENNIIFKVVDNGIGVPDDQKDHLFTKFFRADNAIRESPNGTGIGLYLVKRVVEDQHGSVIFSSKIKQGSTFGFKLPILT